MVIAEELAKKQKAISIAEFFEKNRQILGFDSNPRSLLTSVKEAVDNSLDACEEAGILPDIFIKIESISRDNITLIVEDNGPGIVKEQIPKVFAKLLYGSRFHSVKQSRGQQGIGISAAVLYSQLTSGRQAKIISKIDRDAPAHYFELLINTQTNEPEILSDKIIEWERLRGTHIELEMEASYVKGRRQSVYEYLKDTAIVNPHARITLIEPDNNQIIFERATDKMPVQPAEILPHPHGIELGTLMKMLRYSETDKLGSFLRDSFSRIGPQTAKEICKKAGIDEKDPRSVTLDEAKRLHEAFSKVKILAPPTDCLSPITEELIRKGLEKEHTIDFIETTTRPAAVHSGHPFQVEAGIAYGGNLPKNEKVEILRFANRVPLLYQQGACAITHAIENIKWKNYSLDQPGGSFPTGPAIILVHVASTHIPFTSESKEAIADVPEIVEEIELALKEVARRLKLYLSKQDNLLRRREKEEIIQKILPRIAKKVGEILELPAPDITPVVAKIMGNIFIQRIVKQNGNGCDIEIRLKNHGGTVHSFNLHETLPYAIESPSPEPKKIPIGKQTDYLWKISLKPGEQKAVIYRLDIGIEESSKLPPPLVEGISNELITGAKVVMV